MGNQLDALAKGPSSTYLKYQGYEINGFTFYTKKQDGKSTYQNCGVCFDAHDENGNVQATYYAFIEEICVTEPTNYMKLSKKIIHQSRRLSKLKPV